MLHSASLSLVLVLGLQSRTEPEDRSGLEGILQSSILVSNKFHYIEQINRICLRGELCKSDGGKPTAQSSMSGKQIRSLMAV